MPRKKCFCIKFVTDHRALCHSQALVIRKRVYVFRNSLFAAQPDEEPWMRMNKGEERRGEGWLISYCILNGARRWPRAILMGFSV
jgi:hypothetical protein